MSMRFGIHNPSFRFEGDPTDLFAGLAARAQWAEENGFAWFSVMDHLIQIPVVGAPDEPFMEGWTALAGLAAVTRRIRLATLVTSVAYRNPALLARIAAGVDNISRGRLTFGFGAGWFAEEYRQYGYVFPEAPAERIRQMADALRLIKAMWTEPRATYQGKYFSVHGAILEPKPTQRPHPPIMIGGSGEQLTLRYVARLANACNIFGSPEEVAHKFAVLRRHCEEVGRDYAEIERTNTISLLLAHDAAGLAAKRQRLQADGFRGFAGTVTEAKDLIGRYRDVGVQLLISSAWRNDFETQQLLAAEIIPALA
jgi:F420-dependent oxidoreductase-like protein